MDVRLSPEQQALRETAARLVERSGPKTVNGLGDRERSGKLDAAVAGAGWRELRAPTTDGSPLASGVEVAIVAEELARGAADTAFVGPSLATELRRLAGAAPSLASETVALTDGLSALASNVEGAVAIDASAAAQALTSIPIDGGCALAATSIDALDAGVDLTRPMGRLARSAPEPLGDARVLTADDLTRWTAFGLALTCADLVGTMRGAIELAREYVADRRQFGVPVGTFQAVQHLLADAHVSMEGSRSATLHAAWAVDALPPAEALLAAAVAKAYCARAARVVCESAIQVHGGIGNTWECFAHIHLRRALLSIDVLGGVGPNLDRVLDHHQIGAGRGLR